MVLLVGITLVLLVLETFLPLAHSQDRWQHVSKNALMFLIARGALFVVSLLALEQFSVYSFREVLGSFFVVYVFVLSDLSVYWWHRCNHRIPFLWRFHQVHHLDQHLDVSTALRFHFGEMTLSYVFRASVFLLLGFELQEVLWYNIALTTGNLFIHSNLALPIEFERLLSRVLVTPRIHRTHHSLYRLHTDSNYSTTWIGWDHIFNSFTGIHDTAAVGLPYETHSSLKTDLLLPMKPLKPWPSLYKGTP